MHFRFVIPAFLLGGLLIGSARGQQPQAQAVPPAQGQTVASMLQPGTIETSRALSALNIRRWKASGDVKDAMQQNVSSIQADLSNTLPGLIQQADAAPASVPEAFAVYRNLDALYDVLLRLSENATLAGPSSESSSLQSALNSLKQARANLGEAILGRVQGQQAEIARLKNAMATAAAAPPPHASGPTVVDDGPAKAAAAAHKKKKAPAKPATTTTGTQTPASSPTSSPAPH